MLVVANETVTPLVEKNDDKIYQTTQKIVSLPSWKDTDVRKGSITNVFQKFFGKIKHALPKIAEKH